MLSHFVRSGLRAMVADRWFGLANLGGLALGLACVILVGLFVHYELSYDDFLPDSDTLYRVDTVESVPGQPPIEIALTPGPLKPALLSEFPQIEAVSRAFAVGGEVLRGTTLFREKIVAADPDFLRVLRLPLLAGDAGAALADPGSVVLSARLAEKLFGSTAVVGRRLSLRAPVARDFVVSAVFETLPSNSHMDFDLIVPHAAYFGANTDEIRDIPDSWAGAYFHTYARLRPGADPREILERLPAVVDRRLPPRLVAAIGPAAHDLFAFRLVPIRDVHFEGAELEAMRPPGSRAGVMSLSAVALLVLVIASVNFANLTAARSTLRAREVALRKVVGASSRQILAQFLVEAIVVAGASGVAAIALSELLGPYAANLLGLGGNPLQAGIWQVWAGVALLILLTAVAAGLYPSVLASRIRPAAVFNGSFAFGAGGRARRAFVVGQFAISISLIAVVATMLLQFRMTRDADLGFDRKDILVVRVADGSDGQALARSLKDGFRTLAGVTAVASSSAVPGDVSEDNLSVRPAGASSDVQLGFHRVDPAFFDTYGVTALAGRTRNIRSAPTSEARPASAAVPIVLNRAAARRLGYQDPAGAIGRALRHGDTAYEVVGVVPDLHFRSLRSSVRAEMFIVDDTAASAISVRFRPENLSALLPAIDRVWRSRIADRPIERDLLADLVERLYDREARQMRLLSIFAALATALSCLGLLAMAAFAVQRRTREIAVRKVLGAGSFDILRLLLWDFAKPVLIAAAIGCPAAWMLARHWLNGFSYRIDMPYPAIAGAAGLALILALMAVAFHAAQVSRTRPALALRRD